MGTRPDQLTETQDPLPATAGAAAGRPRRWLWVAIAVAVGCVAFALYWFQPQQAFIDERVDDAIPTVTTGSPEAAPTDAPEVQPTDAAAPAPPDTTVRTEPLERARGEFVSIDHGTSGIARVLELADGSRIVRLEGLDTSSGPDLFVYLSTNAAAGDEAAFDDDFVNLGRLQGNQGDQNYDLPAEVDLARFASVVVWCDRFDSAFGAADLAM